MTEGQQALDLLRRIAEALERAYPTPSVVEAQRKYEEEIQRFQNNLRRSVE